MKSPKKAVKAKTKKEVVYKVDDLLLVKKAPESLKFLVGLNLTIAKVNKLDLELSGSGTLVVSFHMIKRGEFEFAKKRKPKA